MAEYEGKILQIIYDGVTIKDLLHPDFVSKLEEEFKDVSINPINLHFVLEKEGQIPNQIRLAHKNRLQIDSKELIVDVSNTEDLDFIVNSINVVK